MIVQNYKDCENIKIEKFPYKGYSAHEVKGVSVRWLSKCGEDDMGTPEYGLRYFTTEPGGEIPVHNHFYHQTMYILSGRFECWQFDKETDAAGLSGRSGSGGCRLHSQYGASWYEKSFQYRTRHVSVLYRQCL